MKAEPVNTLSHNSDFLKFLKEKAVWNIEEKGENTGN